MSEPVTARAMLDVTLTVTGLVVEEVKILDAPSREAARLVAERLGAVLSGPRKGRRAQRYRPNLKRSPKARELPRLEAFS